MLNTTELSADWAASGNITIVALTISQSDKYKTNVTFFLPLLQLPVRDLSLSAPALCVLGSVCAARR